MRKIHSGWIFLTRILTVVTLTHPKETDSGMVPDSLPEADAPVRRRRRRRGGVAQHGRLGSAGGGVKGVVKWFSIGLVTVLVGLLGTAGLAVAQIASNLTFVSENVIEGAVDSSALAIQDLSGGFNFLVVGTDTRDGQDGDYTASGKTGDLADVIILLHVSDDHKSATVVSFPRDLMVAIPSCAKNDGSGEYYSAMSKQQINSSITYGGVSCTVATIENLTGLSIPYYALVDFNGVIEMSNAVGGVTVCSTGAVNDPESGLVLVEGENTLEGDQALAFLRTRHGFGDGSDLARISAQQVFLSALMRQMTSTGTLTNAVTLYLLASTAAENLQLSSSLADLNKMLAMAGALASVDLDNMVFVQAPTTADPENSNRVVLSDAADVLFEALVEDEQVSLSDDSVGRGSVVDESSEATSSSSATAEASESAVASDDAASSSEAADDSTSVTLPSGVTGQTAATQTCAKAAE